MIDEARHRHRVALVWALIGLSPFVGEFMLGNQPITALPSLLIFAPMYGCGAVLIREVARRGGLGWTGVILLAAAYALIEEGLVDQMLFNPGYLGLPDFSGMAVVPGLGFSARLTLDSLIVHTVWSICVPIAVVEAFASDETRPWLSQRGLVVTGVVFVGACVALGAAQADEFHFVATAAQLGSTAAAVAVLVAGAVLVGRRKPGERSDRCAPSPRRLTLAAFGASSGYWIVEFALEASTASDEWLIMVVLGVYALISAGALMRVSRRSGWGRRHVFAVAAGTLLTYCWLGIVHSAFVNGLSWFSLLGSVAVTTVGSAVLILATRAQHRRDAEEMATVVQPQQT